MTRNSKEIENHVAMEILNDIPIILLSRNDSMGEWFVLGSIISYLAVFVNVFTFCVLCQKRFMSPATILLQGLALADGLTALFTFGFEPFFLNQLKDISNVMNPFNGTYVTLMSPYCDMYVYVVQLSCDCFHYMSILLTTCIGVQKVIALQFPLWTRTSLTIKKMLVCCFVCFIIPIAINFPVLIAHSFKNGKFENVDICLMSNNDNHLESYVHKYQPVLTSILLIFLCLLMMTASVYITYKMCTNKFRKRLAKNEKKSIVMVFILLLIFLISEVPRIVGNITYILVFREIELTLDELEFQDFTSATQQDKKFFSFLFAILRNRESLEITDHDVNTARIFFETIKLLTVVACLSNIFIYIIMSQKLRLNLKGMFIKTKRNTFRKIYNK